MKTMAFFGVWAYMILAVIAEVLAFHWVSSYATLATVVCILAASQAMSIVVFFMHLKDEPGALRLFALVPIMFLSALLIAMVATLG